MNWDLYMSVKIQLYLYLHMFWILLLIKNISFLFLLGPFLQQNYTDIRLNNATCFVNWNVCAIGYWEYVSFPSTLCWVTRDFCFFVCLFWFHSWTQDARAWSRKELLHVIAWFHLHQLLINVKVTENRNIAENKVDYIVCLFIFPKVA